ncbi:uncharacterized protein N7500_007437 [Penicillium coprophilum]|uniref:uncharacterized protein n=1 Tax=Penicillium coprophilum TaxID=36646 RepID=UPI0023A1CFD9|nr:uncharacterized protein N7500_007437 [Penicillium coprophilum]KAJ5165607.1 hypothetical protein N7500_007437 [Penicillium coprophilum]
MLRSPTRVLWLTFDLFFLNETAMSFGFSIGDFLGIIKDIHHIRRVFNGAPAQFKFLNDEVRRLSILIQAVETYIPNATQKDKLEQVANDSKSLIQDIWQVIGKYREIGQNSSIKHVWKRLRLDPEDVRELRDRVCSVIESLTAINVRITQDQVQELVSYKNEEQHQKHLDWLSSESFTADWGKPIYQPGTGRWFIESPEFQNWIQNPGQTLFCPGIPGAGKSNMASIVIDELDRRHGEDPSVGVAYIFCSFRYCDDPRQSTDNVLASMIRQLIRRLPLLPSTVQLLYEKHRSNGSRPSFKDLSKVFKDVVQMALKKVFIVIDALDECKAVTISRILSQISEARAAGNLNLLSTSRSVPAIEARFQGIPFREIRAAKEDVLIYLKARLENCEEDCALIRRPALQEKAVLVIADSVKGMFLLAQLYLDSLISAPRAKEINDELERLVNRSNQIDEGNIAVDDAYRDVVERINNQDPRRQRLAKDTLSWVICAKRPLTTLELRTALTIELGGSDLNEEDLYDLEDIISSCAGLITIGSDGTTEVVQLAHYTMQEYFKRHQAGFFPDADKTIAESCLTYLSYDIFCQGMCSNDIKFEARLSRYPLYSYAAKNWGHHARVHPTRDDLLLYFFRNTWVLDASVQALFSVKGYYGFESYCLRVPLGFTAFHLAAWFGLEEVLQFLISQCDGSSARDSTNRDPLAWAASNGHLSVVKMLLDHGVDPLRHDEDGQTPISLAALNGYTEAVKLFLDYNVDPNPRDIGSKVPLTEAAYQRHHDTVELLLNRGAHPDPKNNYGRTPFIWACYNGSIEIVRSLLDHSVLQTGASGSFNNYCIDFGRRDDQENTAVSYALDHGHHDIIQLLREKGVLLEQDSHIDELFCNWSTDARADDVTTTIPHIGPAIGWPFIEAQGMSHNKRKAHRRSFKCPICTQVRFSAAGSFLRHVRNIHCSDTRWKCPHHSCGGSFNRRDKLASHFQAKHGGILEDMSNSKQKLDPPARCLVCQIPLSSWAAFNSCIMKHGKEISNIE